MLILYIITKKCYTIIKNIRKRGGEISSPLAYEEVDAIATIVELVREVVEPVIEAPFELVDIEYGKIGSDMFYDFSDQFNDRCDCVHLLISKRRRCLPASLSYILANSIAQINQTCKDLTFSQPIEGFPSKVST